MQDENVNEGVIQSAPIGNIQQQYPGIKMTEIEMESAVYKKLSEGAVKTEVVKELSDCGVDRLTIIRAVEKYAKIVEEEKIRMKTTAADMVPAIAGGVIGGCLGGFVWGFAGVITDHIYGIIAILVGVASGYGVLLFTRGKRGPVMQFAAALGSVAGVLFGVYYITYYVVKKYAQEQGITDVAGMFSPQMFSLFAENFTKILSPFDYVFMILAIASAWKIPAEGK